MTNHEQKHIHISWNFFGSLLYSAFCFNFLYYIRIPLTPPSNLSITYFFTFMFTAILIISCIVVPLYVYLEDY